MRDTKAALDKAADDISEKYHATVKAGKADTDLAWQSYCIKQLRSAYYLYIDTETK